MTKEKIINEITSNNLKNRELVLFFDFIKYEPQLFLLNNEKAFKVLKMIYMSGGAVRRLDLINIAFNKDKKIYELINKMIELNLLNLEGKRDSIVGLTSISLSILKNKRVKNSIKISQLTKNSLDKSEFIMKCNSNNIFVETDIKSTLYFYAKKHKNVSDINNLLKICFQTLSICKNNNIFVSKDLKSLVVYALNETDFYKKLDNINSIKYKLKDLRFNIETIVLKSKNFEYKINNEQFIDKYKYNQSICYNEDIFNTILIRYI